MYLHPQTQRFGTSRQQHAERVAVLRILEADVRSAGARWQRPERLAVAVLNDLTDKVGRGAPMSVQYRHDPLALRDVVVLQARHDHVPYDGMVHVIRPRRISNFVMTQKQRTAGTIRAVLRDLQAPRSHRILHGLRQIIPREPRFQHQIQAEQLLLAIEVEHESFCRLFGLVPIGPQKHETEFGIIDKGGIQEQGLLVRCRFGLFECLNFDIHLVQSSLDEFGCFFCILCDTVNFAVDQVAFLE
mmetsp:Transcript_18102/g.51520  ORF Transcript_18102/g.51520 Transcript_18102/m.51520 type:complete len:244 (+) Transcript_18102:622-1353(+)